MPVPAAESAPVVDTIVATPVTLLLHVPPVEASDKVVVPSGHIAERPLIATGFAFTVSTVVTLQPVEVAE